MSGFEFKEHDAEGLHTLEAVAGAGRFNAWMAESVMPHMQGNILEVGSGIGNISAFFLAAGAHITLSDIRQPYCEALRMKFPAANVEQMDLVDPAFQTRFSQYKAAFDSVFALNVIEHIEDHSLALRNIHWMLKPGGRVLILVPAGPWLYNRIDAGLYHFRRYTRRSLCSSLSDAGFRIGRSWYFNALGIPAWMTGGWLLRERELKPGQMNAYDKLIPLAKTIDRLTLNRLGLSVLALGFRGSED
jgi:SAM-dependent methyltransferase